VSHSLRQIATLSPSCNFTISWQCAKVTAGRRVETLWTPYIIHELLEQSRWNLQRITSRPYWWPGDQRSEVKVTSWFKYVVAKSSTLTLGRRRPSFILTMLSARCVSVPVGILNVTHQGAACDAASIHSCLTIRRTDVLV